MIPFTWRRYHLVFAVALIGLSVSVSSASNLAAVARGQSAYVRFVRAIATDRLGVRHPSGLAFAPAADAFLLADAGGAAELVQLSPLADRLGTLPLPSALSDPLNMAFDGVGSRLVTFGAAGVALLDVRQLPGRELAPAGAQRGAAQRYGVREPKGMAFDPASGRMFILDGAGPAVVRVDPAAARGGGPIMRADLRGLGAADLGGLAFNPRDGHLYMLSRARQTLYEITVDGRLVAARDLARIDAALSDPQAMVFAPSGDQTDDPDQLSLYVADSRASDPWHRPGRIVELSLDQPAPAEAAATAVPAILVQTIDLSKWSTPSPDPMDMTYLPGSKHLLISDSEVEEAPQIYWHGANQFETTLSGELVETYTTFTAAPTSLSPSNFSDEPSGVAYNALNGHWVYADDVQERIIDVDLGPDKVFGTSDDSMTSFRAKSCGDYDAESVAVDTRRGHLLLVDGLNSEVFDIAPGPNGIFDGCAPDGDDVATHFDTASMGILDPEAIEYNPDANTIFVSGAGATTVIETTSAGGLLKVFDLSSLKIDNPSGLAYAPSSLYPWVKTLYICARGKDNNTDPFANDGKVYEIALAPLPPLRLVFVPFVAK